MGTGKLDEATGLYPGLSYAHRLLDQLSEDANPDTIAKLRTVIDALGDERTSLQAELQTLQAEHASAGKLMPTFRNELLTRIIEIQGNADLILNQLNAPLSPTQAQYLNAILRDVEATIKLFHNFTDAVSIRDHSLELTFGSASLHDVSRGFQARLADKIKAREHKLVIDIPDDLPNVWVDLWRLDQVLTELVTNACTYTANGGTITLHAEETPDGVRISISDTGMGMKPAQLSRLGELFYRSIHPWVQAEPGAGLGFYLASNLVHMMGGAIEVDSQPGRGTTCTFTVPIATQQ